MRGIDELVRSCEELLLLQNDEFHLGNSKIRETVMSIHALATNQALLDKVALPSLGGSLLALVVTLSDIVHRRGNASVWQKARNARVLIAEAVGKSLLTTCMRLEPADPALLGALVGARVLTRYARLLHSCSVNQAAKDDEEDDEEDDEDEEGTLLSTESMFIIYAFVFEPPGSRAGAQLLDSNIVELWARVYSRALRRMRMGHRSNLQGAFAMLHSILQHSKRNAFATFILLAARSLVYMMSVLVVREVARLDGGHLFGLPDNTNTMATIRCDRKVMLTILEWWSSVLEMTRDAPQQQQQQQQQQHAPPLNVRATLLVALRVVWAAHAHGDSAMARIGMVLVYSSLSNLVIDMAPGGIDMAPGGIDTLRLRKVWQAYLATLRLHMEPRQEVVLHHMIALSPDAWLRECAGSDADHDGTLAAQMSLAAAEAGALVMVETLLRRTCAFNVLWHTALWAVPTLQLVSLARSAAKVIRLDYLFVRMARRKLCGEMESARAQTVRERVGSRCSSAITWLNATLPDLRSGASLTSRSARAWAHVCRQVLPALSVLFQAVVVMRVSVHASIACVLVDAMMRMVDAVRACDASPGMERAAASLRRFLREDVDLMALQAALSMRAQVNSVQAVQIKMLIARLGVLVGNLVYFHHTAATCERAEEGGREDCCVATLLADGHLTREQLTWTSMLAVDMDVLRRYVSHTQCSNRALAAGSAVIAQEWDAAGAEAEEVLSRCGACRNPRCLRLEGPSELNCCGGGGGYCCAACQIGSD